MRHRGSFHGGDGVLHRLLHLLERADFDLADALARDAKLVGEFFQRDRLVGKPARFEDAPFAIVEHAERCTQRLMPVVRLLGFGEAAFLADAVVDQPVHPLAGIAIFADRRIQRSIAAEPPVHVDHVLLGHAQPLGDELDLIGPHVAFLKRGNPALGFAQVEEQLLLVGGGAHLNERPRAQDVFLNRRLDPPHGVSRQPEAFVRLEALHRLHQADIALGNDLGDRQAVAAIPHGDLGDEPQMAGHEPMRRFAIFVLAPALRQHEFFLRFQHRKPPYFFQIPGQAGFTRQDRQGCSLGHDSALSFF